jgi:hypothetical protein
MYPWALLGAKGPQVGLQSCIGFQLWLLWSQCCVNRHGHVPLGTAGGKGAAGG